MTGRRPIIFYTNGYEHWLWDDAAGYPLRQVQGFFAVDELELMIVRREGRKSLPDTSIRLVVVPTENLCRATVHRTRQRRTGQAGSIC